jgi:hypothetical protein
MIAIDFKHCRHSSNRFVYAEVRISFLIDVEALLKYVYKSYSEIVCVRAYVWKLEYPDVSTTDLFLAKMEKEPRLAR